MMRITLTLFAALALAACASDDNGPAGDGDGDLTDACAGTTGCNGECEVGNEMGVGRYCTPDGNECRGQLAAFCTVDFNDSADSFCTRPCNPDGDVVAQCGVDAICRTEDGSGPAGCVPNSCL